MIPLRGFGQHGCLAESCDFVDFLVISWRRVLVGRRFFRLIAFFIVERVSRCI